ncbi:MAG: Gx transporter family protein [Clostridiales Family XIII bacterium]|jgi:heptaprenyl diphosphate synthase|nr:Gx transporter family protein [Clostridiales Family XIII bacterium]
MRSRRAHRLAFYALMLALAMIFSYLETLIPVPFFVPGMKLGLANVVTMVVLYKIGAREAAVISLARICLSALLFSGAFGLIYSLAGGALSLAVMILLKRSGRFGMTGVSVAGGVCHNFAQIGVAALLLETGALLSYLPVLVVSGAVTGWLIGMLGGLLLSKLARLHL